MTNWHFFKADQTIKTFRPNAKAFGYRTWYLRFRLKSERSRSPSALENAPNHQNIPTKREGVRLPHMVFKVPPEIGT